MNIVFYLFILNIEKQTHFLKIMSDSDSDTGMPEDFMPEGYPGMEQPQPEEHLWLGTLSGTESVLKFEGCDDAESSLILKRATLDGDCDDDSRHVVQVISLDHTDSRIHGTLCSLSLKNNCSVSLDSMVISPPTAFKLVKGKGPLTLLGNLMKETDAGLESDFEEEDEEAEEVNGVEMVNGAAKIEEMETSSEEGGDEETEEQAEKENKQPAAVVAAEASKKRKSQDTASSNNKKPKTEDIKAKIEANKDKPARPAIKNAKDLIDAIKNAKGGRPSKRGKFENWVKNQFKVDNKDWTDKAWKAVNESK